jgi:hypothetical protein
VLTPMLMKEFTANQIAATLAGHPGSPEQELRLLRLFQAPILTLPLDGEGNDAPTLPSPASGGGKIETQGRELKKAA